MVSDRVNINPNSFWSESVIEFFYKSGVSKCIIAPGYRSSPLVIAASEHRKIKTLIHFDERACAFIALGFTKASLSPTMIITTSGTAVAELYPAIIEAYQTHLPLIVCTADRPAYMRNTGANQTIFQDQIFSNHIKSSISLGLPSLNKKELFKMKKEVTKGLEIAMVKDPGPVHFNFPFEKPLEPHVFTRATSKKTFSSLCEFKQSIDSELDLSLMGGDNNLPNLALLKTKILKSKQVLILCGSNHFSINTLQGIVSISKKMNFLIFADGASGLKFISTWHGILSNPLTLSKIFSDLVISLGDAPTSSQALNFLETTSALKISINPQGKIKDPSTRKPLVFKMKTENFLSYLKNLAQSTSFIQNKTTHFYLATKKEKELNNKRVEFLKDQHFLFEGNVINEIITCLDKKCNLFCSNSLVIRDLDLFVGSSLKSIHLFSNRGASGIDGIVATSIGISLCRKKEKTVLIIGDTALLYDLTSLLVCLKYNTPLLIIVINNDGGGIFNMLPISDYKEAIHNEFFINPHGLNLVKLVESFGMSCSLIKTREELYKTISSFFQNPDPTLIEIKTSSVTSSSLRKRYIRNNS